MGSAMHRRTLLAWLAASFGGAASAQAAFPSRPLRIVVPNAAGGAADITARTVGQKIAGPLGQSVVIDNKPSAGGIVAAVGLCLLLIDQLDWHIPLDKIAVPTILIAVGLSVVFSRRKYE